MKQYKLSKKHNFSDIILIFKEIICSIRNWSILFWFPTIATTIDVISIRTQKVKLVKH